ncbi:MAG: YggS family pyridoxal phosphate-dependent enzyme [Candidatus Omnitrophota bacterium]
MIKDNLQKVKERISSVCSKINRDPGSVTIVCVSKGRGIEQIKEAIETGITDIGENRVQEAKRKYGGRFAISDKHMKLHMVGHLQTNKVKDALNIFDLIQSVESMHLADAINREAAKINKVQDILIEVKTSQGEATKSGLKPEETPGVVSEIAKFKNINIKGLMTIAPIVSNTEETRPYFRSLRNLRDKINALPGTREPLTVLSMGMTDDFEVAIEEGANMIRLGRAIFENVK